MNQPVYQTVCISAHEYQFLSVGRNGRIYKMVRYDKMAMSWKIYNLAFGDWDEKNRSLSDLTVSNNDDRQKILATVAATVIDFTYKNPGSMIHAEGSTRSRTRLYQMGIAAFWHEISPLFDIKGLLNNEWEPFQTKRNYEAFLLSCK